jgi:hypothetical protein
MIPWKVYEKTCILWGNFHAWLKALGYCWTTWQDCTFWLFDILFPNADWYATPTSTNLQQFYNCIFQHSSSLLLIINNTIDNYDTTLQKLNFLNRLVEFIDIVVPTLHYYHFALKHNNIPTFKLLQKQLFKIILFCEATEYSKCFVFYFLQLFCWRNTSLSELLDSHWLLNEEIGEASLSILARSVGTTPQHVKTQRLKENFTLISYIHNIQQTWKDLPKEDNLTTDIFIESTLFLDKFKAKLLTLSPETLPTPSKTAFISLKEVAYKDRFKILFSSVYSNWILPSHHISTNDPTKKEHLNQFNKLWEAFLSFP